MNKTSLILWNVAKNPAPTDFMSGVDMAMANLEKPVSEPDIMLRSFAHNMVKLANNYKAHIPQGFYDLCLTLPRQVQELQTEALEMDFEEEYRIEVLTLCVSVAKKLDLACFCEEAILLFLPDGSIFPPERAQEWRGVTNKENQAEPERLKNSVKFYKEYFKPILTKKLAEYGFLFQPLEGPNFLHPLSDSQLVLHRKNIVDVEEYKNNELKEINSDKGFSQLSYIKNIDYGELCICFYFGEGKDNVYINPIIYFHVYQIDCFLNKTLFNNFYWNLNIEAWRYLVGFESLCRGIKNKAEADDFLVLFEDEVLKKLVGKSEDLQGLEDLIIKKIEPDFLSTRLAQLLCLDHINGGMHADMFKDVGWYFASGIKKEDWGTEWPKLIAHVRQFKL